MVTKLEESRDKNTGSVNGLLDSIIKFYSFRFEISSECLSFG